MKYCFFALILLTSLTPAYNQSGQSGINLNPVIPPSPRSREFEKFIDYKVSLYNGLAETNINFYTIDLDGIKIPIGISYHASGIKYGQNSGDVGMGWSLDPGFRISRTIYGRPDEFYTMPSMNNIMDDLNNNYSTPFQRDYYLSRFMVSRPTAEIPAISALQNDYLDGQYDLFTLGLPDQNCKFLIDNRTNKSIVTLDNDAIGKLSYSTDNDNLINKFDITDNNGIKFKFGEDATAGEATRVFVNGAYKDVKTAWMLKEITSAFGRKINLSYTDNDAISTDMPIYSREIVEGISKNWAPDLVVASTDPSTHGALSAGGTRNYTEKILSSVSTPYEDVTISRNANSTINTILVTKPNGGAIKKVQFYYTVSGSGKSFLDSVAVSDPYNTISEKYKFEYTSKEVNYRNYNSFGYPADFPNPIDCDYPIFYGDFVYNVVDNAGYSMPGYTAFCGLDKRWWGASQDGMLRKVTFPTGGSREFQYEGNKFRVPGQSLTTGAWGGLRISQIKSIDETGKSVLIKNYSYPNDAVAMFDPYDKNLYIQRKKILVDLFWIVPHVFAINKTTQTSVLDNELSEAINQPNNGWYDLVIESVGTGKTEYKYQLPKPEDLGIGAIGPNIPEFNSPFQQQYLTSCNFWNKPQLIEKTIYKTEALSGQYTPLRKEIYQYTDPNPSPSDNFVGIKVFPYAISQPGVSHAIGTWNTDPAAAGKNMYSDTTGLKSVFNYATFSLTRGYSTLWKKTVTDYGNQSSVTTTVEYEYRNAQLIKSEKIVNSNKDTIFSKYTYPFDYLNVTGTDNISNGIKTMIVSNTINPVVEKSTFIKSAGSSFNKLISSSFNSFKSNIPVPDKLYVLQSPSTISDFSPAKVQNGSVVIDNRYNQRLSFNVYNSIGNLLEQQKSNDIKEAYLWSYSNQYPVVKITGSDLATVLSIPSLDTSLLNTGTDAQRQAQFTLIRNYFSAISGVQISTYTYTPLIGMTSETDPTGRTIYYEYDGLGRLNIVKDDQGKIIKKICYNYAGQIVDCATGRSIDQTPSWAATGNTRCAKDASNNNTGYQEREERDTNPYSSTYNQLHWVSNGMNTASCPLACPNCTGEDKKCISGVCKTGTKEFTKSVYNNSTHKYTCTYHYLWPDGSVSQDYTITQSSACPL